ncbi:hypothetical protein SLH46_13415 [Draconibacterium sp. IB214405]|uniref:hypothetical protein n=1 Tax=Draconibacterium sp. IB214405 TaxID=3097352 RepID=UPI002A0FA012|nr:hypothetical protein [Draconibacterium sp. IB214405]MDX8340192.1 hypothetical protein [Draconibacterium sp. IB214405]
MKALKIILSIVVMGLIFGGCAYNFITEEEVIDPSDPDAPDVSFSTEIVPIFSSKCVACHYAGNQMPDLSPENAYSSINSSRYVNTSDPASSLIYTKPSPTGSHVKYSEAEAALVLTWITQGAQNN